MTGGELLTYAFLAVVFVAYRWKKRRTEAFHELKRINPQLYDAINAEANSFANFGYQSAEKDAYKLKVFTEYKKQFAIGRSFDDIYRERRENNFGPF